MECLHFQSYNTPKPSTCRQRASILDTRRCMTERKDRIPTEQRLDEVRSPCQKAIGSNIRRDLEIHRHTLESLALDKLPGNVSFLTNVEIIIRYGLGPRFEELHDWPTPPDHLPQSIHSFVFNNPSLDLLWIRYITVLILKIEERKILPDLRHITNLGAPLRSRKSGNSIRSLGSQYLRDNGTHTSCRCLEGCSRRSRPRITL